MLIHNGKVYRDVMERERLSQADLDMALRRSGCSSVEEVQFAVLETNGQVSVRLRDHPPADSGKPPA